MRIKAKVKNNMLTLQTRIPSSYDIQKQEVKIISENSIRGLLRPECCNIRGIKYVGPEGIPLKTFIKRGLSKYDFFLMMYQVVEVIKKVKNLNLSVDNILFDLNYIYINEKTKEMLYIYMPVTPCMTGTTVPTFMEQVALQAEFEDEDIDYVAEYINYVNAITPFDEIAVEQYISMSEELVGKRIARNKYLESRHTGSKKTVTSHENDETEMMERKAEPIPERMPAKMSEPVMDVRSNMDDETELLSNENVRNSVPETFLEKVPTVVVPRIVNKNTGEVVRIEKRVFRIGKEKRCVDLCLEDAAVSRKHADIIVRGDKYYVYDHGSKNHTYINGVKVPVGEEVLIRHGDRLSFAEEEFSFYTE